MGGRDPRRAPADGRDAVAWTAECEQLGAGSSSSPPWIAMARGTASTWSSPRPWSRGCGIPVIASGGVGTLDHLVEGVLEEADAVLAASIFHFGEFTVAQAKAHLANAGVAVRPA